MLDELDRELASGRHANIDSMTVYRDSYLVYTTTCDNDYDKLFADLDEAPGQYPFHDPAWHPSLDADFALDHELKSVRQAKVRQHQMRDVACGSEQIITPPGCFQRPEKRGAFVHPFSFSRSAVDCVALRSPWYT